MSAPGSSEPGPSDGARSGASTQDVPAPDPAAPATSAAPDERYARYVLFVLVLVYVLNFLDRQIISILAEKIKADIGISDAGIGFLYGTAFAVFYAVFGIPLGRLADVWSRRSLISAGLAFWSAATAVSGLARNFTQLAAARVGVGVGESSATPAAFSMLSDSFPARVRSTVLAIYSSGIYIGAGLGLLIGGQIVDRWDAAFADGGAPFGLAGWQAAYLAVGLPGLLLAIWVATLREPVRGAIDGIPTPPHPHPFRAFFLELRAVLPGFSLRHLAASGAGSGLILANLGMGALVALLSWGLVVATDNLAQWGALGIGLYAAISWMQGLGLRDRPSAVLILRGRALLVASAGFSLLAFSGYGLGFWTPIFLQRVHGESAGDVGVIAP